MVSKEAIALCKKWEGLYLKAYLCPAGVPTVGYGATGKDIKLGMTVTKEWAEERLLKELEKAQVEALRLSPILAKHPFRLAAIVSFIYNLGATRYAASTLRRKINEGIWWEAAIQIQRWNRAAGKVLRGLVSRRQEEARMLLAEVTTPT